MKHLFVPYSLALLAKERGFDDWCLTVFQPSPFPPYEWKLSAIIKTTSMNPDEEDQHYKGYRNSIPMSYGLKSCAAPLYQQLVDWFREKYKIDCRVFPMFTDEDSYKTCWGWNVMELEWGEDKEHHIAASVSTATRNLKYYEALTAALTEAFKLIP